MITSRSYQNGDYERVMGFLREMYELKPNQHCLLPQRWEDNENTDPEWIEEWHNQTKIWEENNRIVAVGTTDYGFGIYFNIHPGYYEMTDVMIDWAETVDWGDSEEVITDGKRTVYIWSTESNTFRNECLIKRGYIKPEVPIYLNIQYLDKEISTPEVPEGYTIRSMSEDIELLKRYEISKKGFYPVDEYVPEISEAFYARIKAPMYRRDLDIVTEYKDGTLSSCCILWYDEKTKTGMFEPVATHPDHRRKGLAKAGMIEAMERLKKLGAKAVYVDCYGDERKAFYSSAGFESHDKGYFWRKYFDN